MNARPLPVQIDFSPKTYDIDFAGHVSNQTAVRWLEDLRLAWLDEYYPLQGQLEEGVAPTLLRTEIDYLKQIRLFDRPIRGELWVAETGRVKWVLAAEFTHQGEAVARARQTGLWFDLKTGRPLRIPRELRDRLEEAS